MFTLVIFHSIEVKNTYTVKEYIPKRGKCSCIYDLLNLFSSIPKGKYSGMINVLDLFSSHDPVSKQFKHVYIYSNIIACCRHLVEDKYVP